MRKILLITRPIAPPWDEASKNFAFSLAKDLNSDQSLQLHLLTNGKVSELPENVIQHQIYTHSQNDFGFSQKIRLFWFLLLNAGKFDIVHLLFTPTKMNTFFIKKMLIFSKTKTIQTIATLREDIFSEKVLKKMIFSDLAITYSEYAKNKLEKIGIKNVIRIYPGINVELFSPKEKNPEALSKFNLQDSDFVVTYPGEYVRLGATDDIVAMLPKLFAKIPNAKFVFANRIKNEKDANKKKEIVSVLKANGVLEKVVFTDTFPDMPKVLNFSDVVIFPVRDMRGKFDVPLAVIEAMACAKPVVISNLPILKEFTSSENSVVIDPTNQNALLEALLDLFENKEKCAKIGETAKEYVAENFDIKNVAQQYAEAYKSLIK